MSNLSDEKRIDFPLPILVIDENGKVLAANDKIGEVFLYDNLIGTDIFALTAIQANDIKDLVETGDYLDIERNNKTFKLSVKEDAFDGQNAWYIIFQDVTSFTSLKEKYIDEKPCSLKIEIDNYDELIYPTGEDPNLTLSSNIDKIVRTWANKYDGSINRIAGGSYAMWFEQKNLNQMIEDKFQILDEIRELDTSGEFPASLSIGIGAYGKNMSETEEFSDEALELAQGRGGDQAVVKKSEKVEYFGGNTQAKNKGNKGKSRIVGHALKRLILNSRNVIIMGHKYSDMDSFGSALGIYRFVRTLEKEAYISIDEISESLERLYSEARSTDEYNIVNSERAIELAEKNTLLIVVDTHMKSLVQTRELLDICEKIVIIDHHRRTEDIIDNPTLSYMETYASSASELVTEMLEFASDKKKKVEKLEAEALLSGMTIDTDNFTMKTGVRTFEAATWLRRQGADPTEVKRFFQEDFDLVKVKALSILNSRIYGEDIAITTLEYVTSDAQILCAQIADELLTLKDIKASFVVGKNPKKTVISARSLGKINVQVIMEKLGGGGHLSVAAAQVDLEIEETICKILEILGIEG